MKKEKHGDMWHTCKKCGYSWPTEEHLNQQIANSARNPEIKRRIGDNTNSLKVLKLVYPVRFESYNPAAYDKVPEENKKQANEWIAEHIRPFRLTNSRDSYSLKHVMQHDHDSGLYLTDGEFKGAMLAAGYTPINMDDRTWHWKIQVKIPGGVYGGMKIGGWDPVDPLERRKMFGAFTKWLLRQHKRDDPVGDLARDVKTDVFSIEGVNTWLSVEPKTNKAYKKYLEEQGACSNAIDALDLAFKEYYAYRNGFKSTKKVKPVNITKMKHVSFKDNIRTLVKKGKTLEAIQELFYGLYAGDATIFEGKRNPGLFSHDMLYYRNEIDEEILSIADPEKWFAMKIDDFKTGDIRDDEEYEPTIVTDDIWKKAIRGLVENARIKFYRIENDVGWVLVALEDIDYTGRKVMLARDKTAGRIDGWIKRHRKPK